MVTIVHNYKNYKSLAYYIPEPDLVFGVRRFGKKRVTLELIEPRVKNDNFTNAKIKMQGEKIYYSQKRCLTRKEFNKNYVLGPL